MLKIDGMFPSNSGQGSDNTFCIVSQAVVEVLNNGKSVAWIQPSEMTAIIQDDCNSARARDSSTFLGSGKPASWFGPYNCVLSGKGMYIPPYINTELFPRVKTNTGERWAKRKQTNDIILTNHIRGSLRIDYVPGLVAAQTLGRSLVTVPASSTGLWPKDKDGYIVIRGRKFSSFNIGCWYARQVRNQSSDPRPKDWSPKTYEYNVKGALVSLLPDKKMVTQALAKANSGTIELLSTLGELPETVQEIMTAIQAILTLYRDARKKAFRVYNRGGSGSKANTAWRNSVECAQAISDVWMTWRFSIRPNEYLINDLIDIYYSKVKEFIRFRELYLSSFTVPSPGLPAVSDAEVPMQHRCMIKRLFDVSRPESLLMQRFAFDGAIALYELTPYSWMLDYFVNLGDWVATLFDITPALAEGSTVSWKIDNQTVSFGTDETGFINVTLSFYRRDVINPSALTCVQFAPDLNTSRIADISAVVWNLFKEELPRDIRSKYKKIRYTE